MRLAWLCAIALIVAAGMADAQTAMAPVQPKAEAYLGKARIPDAIAILPPPPPPGSPQALADTDAFTQTRALQGSERWTLAVRDATQYLPAFECPLGLKFADWPAPVKALIARVARDSSIITNQPKDHFARPRPFIAANGGSNGPICTEADRAELMKSFSYPSGHGTFSWTVGLLLAEMAPDHATDVLARARAFGESRVVCGVHTVSDVTESRTNASILVAVLHSDAAFRADMDTARSALQAALAAPHASPDPGQCRVEADAEAHTPWANPMVAK